MRSRGLDFRNSFSPYPLCCPAGARRAASRCPGLQAQPDRLVQQDERAHRQKKAYYDA